MLHTLHAADSLKQEARRLTIGTMFSASAIGCLGDGNTSLTSGGSISRPATKKKALNPANVKTTASATPTTNLANSFMNFIFLSPPNCHYALSEFIFSPSVPT